MSANIDLAPAPETEAARIFREDHETRIYFLLSLAQGITRRMNRMKPFTPEWRDDERTRKQLREGARVHILELRRAHVALESLLTDMANAEGVLY